jgi:hypothetical protein
LEWSRQIAIHAKFSVWGQPVGLQHTGKRSVAKAIGLFVFMPLRGFTICRCRRLAACASDDRTRQLGLFAQLTEAGIRAEQEGDRE